MISRDALFRTAISRLRDGGITHAKLDARVLACEAFSCSQIDLIRDPDMLVDCAGAARLEGFLVRRLAGEPVSRILARREFWGLTFRVTPDTLDPRPESETLVEAVLDHCDVSAPLSVADMGTGTGCLLLALLSVMKNARGVGVDISPQALAIAQDNAVRLGYGDRSVFRQGDWFAPLEAPVDVLVSNPPYIPGTGMEALPTEVKAFDPVLALNGGIDGLEPCRHMFPLLRKWLRAEGIAVFEFGQGQEKAMCRLAEQAGLECVEVRADLAGTARVLVLKPGKRFEKKGLESRE